MVKAGALGSAHVKSWDRTWSSSDFQQAHRGGLVLKLRPLVTVAGVSQIFFGQQDGRVVKASSFGGERTKYTPDMRGIEILFPQKSP